MSQDAYPLRGTQPEVVDHFVKFVGGAGAVTKLYGPGVTVSYVATGKVRFTWAENPGTFLGHTYGLHATTQSALKGYTAIVGDFSTTAFTLDVWIYDSTFTLADLAAAQWLSLLVKFKRTAV